MVYWGFPPLLVQCIKRPIQLALFRVFALLICELLVYTALLLLFWLLIKIHFLSFHWLPWGQMKIPQAHESQEYKMNFCRLATQGKHTLWCQKSKAFPPCFTTVNYFQSCFTATVNSAANLPGSPGELQSRQCSSDISSFNITSNPNHFCGVYLQLLKISYKSKVCLTFIFLFCIVDSFGSRDLLPGGLENKRDLYPCVY